MKMHSDQGHNLSQFIYMYFGTRENQYQATRFSTIAE